MAKVFDLPRNPVRRGMGPLVFLIVAGLVMVGAMVWLSQLSHESQPVPIRSIESPPPGELLTDVRPWDPKTETWGPISDGTAVGQAETPVHAFKIAAGLVQRQTWGQFVISPTKLDPNAVGFQRLDVEKVFRSPARYRGFPVEVIGRLVELEKIDLFDRFDAFKFPDGRHEAYRGRIATRKELHGSAAPVVFTMVDELESLPVIGDFVKLQGVFFKLHRVGAGGERQTGLWLLGKRMLPSFAIPHADEVDLRKLAVLEEPTLAADREKKIFDEPALFHAMAYALHGGTTGEPVVEIRGQETQDLLRDPARYRGREIEFQARVLEVHHHSMASFFPQNRPGDNPIHEFWNTYVTADGVIPLTVMWVKRPDLELKVDDQVRIRGLFYRNWAYTSKKGPTRAPLIIGLGDIERIDIEDQGLDAVAVGVIVYASFTILIVFIVLWVDRRKARLFRDTLRAKRQVERGGVDLNRVARELTAEGSGGDRTDRS